MTRPSIADFRATLKIVKNRDVYPSGRIYSYWNNRDSSRLNSLEEVLHIKEQLDGSFILEIGNTSFKGAVADLEERLYEWAADEGWLDDWHSFVNN